MLFVNFEVCILRVNIIAFIGAAFDNAFSGSSTLRTISERASENPRGDWSSSWVLQTTGMEALWSGSIKMRGSDHALAITVFADEGDGLRFGITLSTTRKSDREGQRNQHLKMVH